jgi:hypothetical protein
VLRDHEAVRDSDPAQGLDVVADELYGLHPDEFVGARDAAVAAARERGDRELARAVGRLRKPVRVAWLANLLARKRADALDELLALAPALADAQRTLDGQSLRVLSGRRQQLVRAMAREAGRLAASAGDPVGEGVLRELQGVLDAALADPAVAEEVRVGRLTRAVSHTGFGPASDLDAVPRAPASAPKTVGAQPAEAQAQAEPDTGSEHDPATERAERELAQRRAGERERAERDLAAAEDAVAAARTEQEAADAARDQAREREEAARERITAVTAELERARDEHRAITDEVRASTAAAATAARNAAGAAARVESARAALDALR